MPSTCHSSSQGAPSRLRAWTSAGPASGLVLPFGLGLRPAVGGRSVVAKADVSRSPKANAPRPPDPPPIHRPTSRRDSIRYAPATGVVPDDAGLRFTAADTARAAKALEAHLARANPKTGEGQPSAGKAKAPSNQLADAAPSSAPTFFDADRRQP
jgi:hypothetical protein